MGGASKRLGCFIDNFSGEGWPQTAALYLLPLQGRICQMWPILEYLRVPWSEKLIRPMRQWTTSNFTFIGARMPGEKLQNWQNFEYSVACRYTHRVYRSALSLACESEPEMKSCIPNVTLIGASYRSCGAKNLKFDEIWNFSVPIATPFTDHGQIWHARVNLACQILLWSCRSREAKTLKFDLFFKFNIHLGLRDKVEHYVKTVSELSIWRRDRVYNFDRSKSVMREKQNSSNFLESLAACEVRSMSAMVIANVLFAPNKFWGSQLCTVSWYCKKFRRYGALKILAESHPWVNTPQAPISSSPKRNLPN